MSLVSWYPLNGDLKDYSGNENHLGYFNNIDINQISESISGKIGKCYERSSVKNGSNRLRSKNKIHLASSFTMCCWVYLIEGDTVANGIFSNHSHTKFSGAGINVKYISGTDYRISCNTGNGTTRTYGTYYGSINIKDKWAHLTVSYDILNEILYLWVNGVLELSVSYKMYTTEDYIDVFGWSTGYYEDTYNPACRINDVRVYDDILTEKEIKEIAKAKILHYTFDTFVEPAKNMCAGNMIIYNNFKVPATLVPSGEIYKGQTVRRLGMTVTDEFASQLEHFKNTLHSHGVRLSTRLTFKANTKYAASIYWKPVNKQDTVFGGLASNIYGWIALPNEMNPEGDGWNRFTVVRDGSVVEDKSDSVHFSFCCPSLELNETIYIDICCPQLEEYKDYSTEYTPSIRKNNIIRDSSGFGNDGVVEIETSPQWIDGGKIGKGCYRFNKDSVIRTNQLFFDNINQCWTVCGWVYVEDNSFTQYFNNFNNGNEIIRDTNGKALLYINYMDNDSYVYSTTQLSNDNWYHIAYVLDTSTLRCQIYINGILDGVSVNYEESDTPVGLFKSTIFGQFFKGMMDDVRVYATDLSPEDILDIYQNRASIDSVGSVYTQGLSERYNLAWLVYKTIKEKKFENGVSRYGQPNLQITLTDKGYRVYSPPNLIRDEVGNTMYGGLRLNLFKADPGIIKKDHKYRISFMVEGQSGSTGIYFSNQMGWGGSGYGLGTDPAILTTQIPTNFKGAMEMYAVFHINDDVWKTCTGNYHTFVKGERYNCYIDLGCNFNYGDTGPLGTDIYITDFKIEDITDGEGLKLTENGILKTSDISETSITDGLVGWWKLDGNVKDYSGNGNDGKIIGSVDIFNFLAWSKNKTILALRGTISNWTNNSFTLTSTGGDCFTDTYGKSKGYMYKVKPNTIYSIIYTKKTNIEDRTIVFYWDSIDDEIYKSGDTFNKTTNGEHILTFTTPSTCIAITLRFGFKDNNNNAGDTDTFSDIQLVEGLPSDVPTISDGLGRLCYDFKYDTLDRIELGNLSNVIVPDTYNFSISVWACSNDITKDQNIISKNAPFFIRIVNSYVRYCINTPIGSWIYLPGKIKLESNKWYNIVMTYDGVYIKGYVNGVLDICEPKTGNVTVSNSIAHIGYTPVPGEQAPFDGKIQDIRIYNKTLSPREVAILHDMQYSNTKITNDGTLYIKGKFKEVIV